MAHPGGDQGVIIGYEAKVRLNGNIFGVKSGSIRYQADVHESGDTEKAAFKRHKAGRKMAEFQCEFSEPKAANTSFHVAPLTLQEGDAVLITVYRNGDLNDPTPDLILGVVESYSFSINLDGVCNGSISARSDGFFFKRGEVLVRNYGASLNVYVTRDDIMSQLTSAGLLV
jgi:hypothetical protein